jgi:PAS domain S-box-containing protein
LRLLLLIAVAVVPAVLLNVFSTVQQQRWIARETHLSALRIARAAAGEQGHMIESARELLTVLSMAPAVRTADPRECPTLLDEILTHFPHHTSLSVIDPGGALICRGLRPGEPAHVRGLAVESAFLRALETRQFAVGRYAIGTVTHKPVVPLALPVLDAQGRVEAVLTATLDLVWLSHYASRADLPPGSTLTVIDGFATVLARYPDPEHWVGDRISESSPLWEAYTAFGEGVVEVEGLDGVARLYAFSDFPGFEADRVRVSVGIPRTEAFGAANRLLLRNLLVLALLGSVAAGMGWWIGTRTILQPVRSLVRATRRLAAGDLGARASLSGQPEGELTELALAFDELAESLEQRTAETARSVAALQRGERRYRSLVEATAAIVWNTPASGEFETPQPWWSEFTGQSFEESRGWGWLQAIHPEDRGKVAHAWALAVEASTLYQGEERLRRHDGEYRHMLVRAVPIFGDDGQLREWIGVHTDITARKRAEQERTVLLAREREARAEAERANRSKSDFLAIVSHELRTPLTSIISYAELMAYGVEGTLSERHREYVERIDVSAWHLKELVDQILDFTQLEAGKVTIYPRPTDLASLIREVAAATLPMAQAKSLSLRAILPDVPVIADTDPTRVRQILLNLLSNAVKFSDQGEIRMEVEPADCHVRIRVCDPGPGIPPEHLRRIWERFWQAENPLTRRAGGTGLGLAIVRRLSELLGGSVQVESAVGRGSTFTLSLPYIAPAQGSHRDGDRIAAGRSGFGMAP